ncbi:glycosyltransferase family 2 protein [Streptomyces sp. NP160]|uniref:glycosyltransferase family 2 protein n=1 Tax=Streptomyces sp. NP160 TaxID=2586637 RepID=UPI0015D5D913|nr:glycosyltransferase family 2 protein [Streptomyces sp. NP160]
MSEQHVARAAVTGPPPVVSVVMPTYNRPELLRRALASLAAQTFEDFEVVVVNDAGTPVDDVVGEFSSSLSITLAEHTTNAGRCGALNTALGLARGTFVNFLDDDDIAYPHHLTSLVDAAAGDTGAVVYSHCVRVAEDSAGRVVQREVFGASDFDAERLLVENYIVGMSALVPLAAVRASGGLDPDLRVLEDWELWIRLSALLPFRHVPVPTAEYRWRSGTGNQSVREQFRFHTALEAIYAKHPVPRSSPLAAARGQMLAGSSARLDAYPYELSVVILCEGSDTDGAVESVQDFAVHLGSSSGVELVLAVPDLRAWRGLVDALEGDVQAFATGDVPPGDVLRFLRARVSGRRLATVRAGGRLDLGRLGDLLARPEGTADVTAAAMAPA